jgi:hypothetical protein
MHSFVQFLTEQGALPQYLSHHLGQRRFVREPIGMIAVGHGVLTPDQIDAVLTRQRSSGERFGSIAVELGFLTQQQVDVLLQIQEFRSSAEIVEDLALAGVLPLQDGVRQLGAALLSRASEPTASPV